MPVKNFFSGVESAQHYQAAIDAGAQHLLMSYLYVTKQQGNILAARKKAVPRLKFMIDSGAHTLQVSMGKAPYNTWKLADFEKYMQGYAEWLDQNRAYVFAAVELDIAYSLNIAAGKAAEDPYGDTVVDEWRRKYFRPLQESGIDIIYVWHPAQGHAGWENLCANFPYVGLPGEMSKQEDFNTFVTIARRYTTKLHGFAATKQSDFRDWPWYSIDSTTWKAGEIYGTLPVWDERNQKLRFLAKADNREAYREQFLDWGLKAEAIINDTDYQEVTRASLKSMTAMEEFYVERFKLKTFYYQLRLPHPSQILKLFPAKLALEEWKRFRPLSSFPQHAAVTNPVQVQQILQAISAVQYRQLQHVTKYGRDFLEVYFPQQLKATIPDTMLLAKEMAIVITPGNETAQRRETEDDYADSANPPRRRGPDEIPELDFDDEIPEHLLRSILEDEN